MKVSSMNWFMVQEQAARDDRALLPLGSTEQHAYLSLSVDTILAAKVAEEAAARLDLPVFPALRTGSLLPRFPRHRHPDAGNVRPPGVRGAGQHPRQRFQAHTARQRSRRQQPGARSGQ